VRVLRRTIVQDALLRGKQLRKGESILMLYASANRDEEVFPDPFRFRVDRDPNPHLAFGFGAHLCLGKVLAKMEIETLFTELLSRVDAIELDGTPALVSSNFVSGLKTLPIRYRMR